MDNVRVPLPILMDHIERHYTTQFVYQIHKILGSADCFCNPVGLFNTISSGVWDLFYEPYQGYMMNDRPQEIGIHLAKGGLSFARKQSLASLIVCPSLRGRWPRACQLHKI